MAYHRGFLPAHAIVFLAKKFLSSLILPPTSLLLLALFGLFLLASSWQRGRRLGGWLAVLGCGGALVLTLNGVSSALIVALEVHPPVTAQGLKDAEAIVVLGGGAYRNAREYGGDTVNRLGLERIRYAARLARESGLPLLLTGGAPFGGRAEAELMREVLEKEFGVPVRWVETASKDTGENAAFSAPLLKSAGLTRIALVSHAWHMRRAIPLFEREGLTVIPAPTIFHRAGWGTIEAWLPGSGELTRIAAHEWLGHWVNELKR